MARTTPLVLAALLLAASFLPRAWARPPGEQPPAALQLEVEGRRYTVSIGEFFEVPVNGTTVRMRLLEDATRQFDNSGGLRFSYPSNYTFHYEKQTDVSSNWTLHGPGGVVALLHFGAGGLEPAKFHEIMLNAMKKNVEADDTTVTEIPVVLAGRTFSGHRLTSRKEAKQIDIVTFAAAGGLYNLRVQGKLDAKGELTAGSQALLSLVTGSFFIPPEDEAAK